MKNYNRFITFSKRILYHKAYILMLFCIIALTFTYKILPEKSKSSNISVAICFEENTKYSEQLVNELENSNSLYSFIYTDSKNELINMVKGSEVECGYFFPANFFQDYIHGNIDKNPAEVYVIPSTTLSGTIGETVFSNIIEVTAIDILTETVADKELDVELEERFNHYINGEVIFTLSSSSGEFNFTDFIYKINIPVFEFIIIFTVISALLGLLLFEQDMEKNMYVTFNKKELFITKLIAISTAVIPIFVTGFLALFITYGIDINLLFCFLVTVISIITANLVSLIIRKSTLLSKVLPLIALIVTAVLFIKDII